MDSDFKIEPNEKLIEAILAETRRAYPNGLDAGTIVNIAASLFQAGARVWLRFFENYKALHGETYPRLGALQFGAMAQEEYAKAIKGPKN